MDTKNCKNKVHLVLNSLILMFIIQVVNQRRCINVYTHIEILAFEQLFVLSLFQSYKIFKQSGSGSNDFHKIQFHDLSFHFQQVIFNKNTCVLYIEEEILGFLCRTGSLVFIYIKTIRCGSCVTELELERMIQRSWVSFNDFNI